MNDITPSKHDITISLNDNQIKSIQTSLSKPATFVSILGGLLPAIQTLALIAGGAWVLGQFYFYQREQIELEHQQLARDVELKEIEVERSQQALDGSKATRYGINFTINSSKVNELENGNSLFEVNYGIELTNTSESPLELSLIFIDYYIAVMPDEIDSKDVFMAPFGSPANRWNDDSAKDGILVYKKIGTFGSILPRAENGISSDVKSKINLDELVHSGYMTGKWTQNQKAFTSQRFLVKTKPGSYVFFIAHLCFNKCNTESDRHFYSRIHKLNEGRNTGV